MGSLGDKPKELINLQLGWPSPYLFASQGLLSGAQAVLTSESEVAAALVYGPHTGHPPLRKSVAEWLTSIYKPNSGPVTHDRIAISNGASANLSNILCRFTDSSYTRKIFMVEPTYFLACPIFEDNGFRGKLHGVPESDEGIDIDFLRRELDAAEQAAVNSARSQGILDVPRLKTGPNYPNKIYKYVVYCVPTFSNPTGKTFSIENRRALVKLAREYDALVVSDDVYDFLSWPMDQKAPVDAIAPPPPRLVDIDRELPGPSQWGNTVSNGSFSKVIGPGVRVGWAEASPSFIQNLGEVGSSSSGGAPSHLTSTFVNKMLETNYLQDYIKNTLITTYRSRYNTLISAIETHLLPLGLVIENNQSAHSKPATAGGYFLYLRLPQDLPTAKTLAAFAFQNYSLRIAFGHMFTVAGDESSVSRAESEGGFSNCIRLCWTWHKEDAITEGVSRLAAAITDIRKRIQAGEDVGSNLAIGIR